MFDGMPMKWHSWSWEVLSIRDKIEVGIDQLNFLKVFGIDKHIKLTYTAFIWGYNLFSLRKCHKWCFWLIKQKSKDFFKHL